MIYKVILALILVSVCTGACLYWNSAVQPDIVTDQTMRQLEIHHDGPGDKLANDRRTIVAASYIPTDIAIGVTTLLLILMFYPDVKKLFKEMSK